MGYATSLEKKTEELAREREDRPSAVPDAESETDRQTDRQTD